ncbi:MAG: hypothetical protein CMD83_18205 [Gammaproteobacteria bacterium]|nr:hypothetical protein [Gammaproteobacteria bacterium]
MAKSYIDLEENLKKNFPLKIKHLPSGEELTFKAMVTQFEDQYSSEWNLEQVFGRMDPIRTFRGTQRIITLGWDVVAASLEEARANMKNCGTLMAMLYPSYTDLASFSSQGSERREITKAEFDVLASGEETRRQGGNASNIKSAPLFQIKFANLISSAKTAAQSDSIDDGVIGSIDGLVYNPDIEQDFFAEGAGVLYPQTIRLSFSLYVAHTHGLGWKAGEKKKQRQDNFPYFVKKGEV